jgi:hypothetical protein
MFNKNIKLVLTALILAVAVWQIIEGNIGNGIMYILLSSIFVFLYFKNEIILLSFLRLRKEDYNYLNGLMVSQTNMKEAEKYFKKAVSLGLSMDTDMAMAKLNLAGIAMSKNRKREAQVLLTEAKKLDKHNMLDNQIKMMKDQMKKAGQPQQQFGRSGRGGRR